MGSAVTVEASKLENIDYDTLKKSGIAFDAAHDALKSKLQKSNSVKFDQPTGTTSDVGSLGSIHYLAIRQLSHNLQNQDKLSQSKKKLLKSRTVPRNLRIQKQRSDRFNEADEDDDVDSSPHVKANDETLGPDDLVLIKHDSAIHLTPETPVPAFNVPDEQSPAGSDILSPQQQQQLQQKKPKRPKPNLSLQLVSENSSNSLAVDSAEGGGPAGANGNSSAAGVYPGAANKRVHSPSANMRVSPHGTLYMGKWKVQENGIFLDETGRAKPFNFDVNNNPSNAKKATGVIGAIMESGGGTFAASMTRKPPPALTGGKKDFIEIAALGSGASGVVTEAVHVPTLTLVALKMLPIYNQQKRQHVSRELGVLYKNLAELELVDDLAVGDEEEDIDDDPWASKERMAAHAKLTKQISGKFGSAHRSPHVLSLYNAFIDARSGMANLVIEYMDGGSLEDLVKQGGCRDETVLADIAFQTVKGLGYLHQHHNIHRDIKPANILCSTTGQIKIADFGIAKALDKTSSFAHSFVGTVCYMSPERITGEHYSYSSDIWSLGLTILAVAKGKFPLSGGGDDEDDDFDETGDAPQQGKKSKSKRGPDDALMASNGVIGGAAGYWAMIKAICDDDPPAPGPDYSQEFNEFIVACLRKDPKNRLSAKELLDLPLVKKGKQHSALRQESFRGAAGVTAGHDAVAVNHVSDSASSPMVMTGSASTSRLPPPHGAAQGKTDHKSRLLSSQCDNQTGSGSPSRIGGFRSREQAKDSLQLELSSPDASARSSRPSTPSALSARLNSAAIVRRVSRDSMRSGSIDFNAQSPSERLRRSFGSSDSQMISSLVGVAAGSLGLSPGHTRIQTQTDALSHEDVAELRQVVPPTDATAGGGELEESPEDIITAIRLEHLDRVLERIAAKLRSSAGSGDSSGLADEEDEEEFDDTDDMDLMDVQQCDLDSDDPYADVTTATTTAEIDNGGTQNTTAVARMQGKVDPVSGHVLQGHDSLDSMDDLFCFDDSNGVSHSGDHKQHISNAAAAAAAGKDQVRNKLRLGDEAKAALLADSPDSSADAKHSANSYSTNTHESPDPHAKAVPHAELRGHPGGASDAKAVPRMHREQKQPMQPSSSHTDAHSSIRDAKLAAPSNGSADSVEDEKLSPPMKPMQSLAQPLAHSILKGGTTYNAEHIGGSGSGSLHSSDDKRSKVGTSKTRFTDAGSDSNSTANRSVHFSDGGEQRKKPKSLRSRLNLQHLEIRDDSYDEAAEEDGADAHSDDGGGSGMALPRTSSYFAKSRKEDEVGDEDNTPTTRSSTKSKGRVVTMDNLEELGSAARVDYKTMLPKLNRRGLTRWENLASQLHLPLHLVKSAVRSKLHDLLDLEDESLVPGHN